MSFFLDPPALFVLGMLLYHVGRRFKWNQWATALVGAVISIPLFIGVSSLLYADVLSWPFPPTPGSSFMFHSAVTGIAKADVSFALVALMFLLYLASIALVLSTGMPVLDTAIKSAEFNDAVETMKIIDNYLKEVSSEGEGSERVLKITSPGEFVANPEDDSIQFAIETPEIIDYFSRKKEGNLLYIAGSDVNCYDNGNLTMENSFIKIAFQKVPINTPLSSIDTSNNIQMIEEKTHNTVIYPANSSTMIDNSSTTGTGYSEILKSGYNLPQCMVHFFVNSTVSYDIFYTLYAGADFIVVDVRNVI